MKKILGFALLMILVVIIIPLLIVRGCGETEKVEEEPGVTYHQEGMKVRVYIKSENEVREVPLEEYIKNVVAAEMPAEFEMEALKAQAVAARTYTLDKISKNIALKEDVHQGADICTDHGHCQAWISKEDAMKKWGLFTAAKNWNKISRAVDETENLIMIYENSIVNAVFHANSGGKTENAEEVWEGAMVSYLKSKPSDGEEAYSGFETTVSIKTKEFYDKLKGKFPDLKLNQKDILKDIKVIEYSEGGRIKNIKIGNLTLKGNEVRSLFALKSTNFKIEKGEQDTLKITTKGYGHGVGMSQWGANHMAKSGGSYEEILKYYYDGVELITIDDYHSLLDP